MIKEIIEEIIAVEQEAKEKLMAAQAQMSVYLANAQDEARLIIEKAKSDAITKALALTEAGAKNADQIFDEIVANAQTAKKFTDKQYEKAVNFIAEHIKDNYGNC